MDLIADIGATNARCALLDEDGRTVRSARFENRDFAGLELLLLQFVGDTPLRRAALAIAGPIEGDAVQMLNIDWRFSQSDLKAALALNELHVLNDFEAIARALPHIEARDCHRIGGGAPIPGTRAVLGPGSGLGVAVAAFDGSEFMAVAGEGGHVSLPALNEKEACVIQDHADASGHCSAEKLLSGPGLSRIYASLAQRSGATTTDVSAKDITRLAGDQDSLAVETYEVFFALLGTVAGNLALTVGARGGVYIAGGIVPRVIDLLERSGFRERFVAKGRYRDYLEAIPTAVITAELPAFIGLKAVLGGR